DRGAALFGRQGFKRITIKLGIIQGVGRLADIKLDQPGLTLRRRVRVSEKSRYNAQRLSLAVADGHAEDRAKSNLHGGIHKWEIGCRTLDVVNGHAALRGKKRGGNV